MGERPKVRAGEVIVKDTPKLLRRESWIVAILMSGMAFILYYLVIYPCINSIYRSEFWQDVTLASVPSPITNTQETSSPDIIATTQETSLAVAIRVPKYVSDFVEREVDIELKYQPRTDPAKSLPSSPMLVEILVAAEIEDQAGESISKHVTLKLADSQDNSLWSGHAEQLLYPGTQSHIVFNVIIPDRVSEDQLLALTFWWRYRPDDSFQPLNWDDSVFDCTAGDDYSPRANGGKDVKHNPPDNSIQLCIDRAKSFSDSAIKNLLLPPWSNGVIPAVVVAIIWLLEGSIQKPAIKKEKENSSISSRESDPQPGSDQSTPNVPSLPKQTNNKCPKCRRIFLDGEKQCPVCGKSRPQNTIDAEEVSRDKAPIAPAVDQNKPGIPPEIPVVGESDAFDIGYFIRVILNVSAFILAISVILGFNLSCWRSLWTGTWGEIAIIILLNGVIVAVLLHQIRNIHWMLITFIFFIVWMSVFFPDCERGIQVWEYLPSSTQICFAIIALAIIIFALIFSYAMKDIKSGEESFKRRYHWWQALGRRVKDALECIWRQFAILFPRAIILLFDTAITTWVLVKLTHELIPLIKSTSDLPKQIPSLLMIPVIASVAALILRLGWSSWEFWEKKNATPKVVSTTVK